MYVNKPMRPARGVGHKGKATWARGLFGSYRKASNRASRHTIKTALAKYHSHVVAGIESDADFNDFQHSHTDNPY